MGTTVRVTACRYVVDRLSSDMQLLLVILILKRYRTLIRLSNCKTQFTFHVNALTALRSVNVSSIIIIMLRAAYVANERCSTIFSNLLNINVYTFIS